MHSAWYRYPDNLHARRVLIVGNNSSGADIAREMCGGAVRTWSSEAGSSLPECVFQSYAHVDQPPPMDYDPRDPASPAWCRKIQVMGPIDHVDVDGTLVMCSGERLADIDLIIWATGFMYQVPFLAPTAPLVVQDAHTRTAPDVQAASVLHNLDDWMLFYKADPSLCFLGLPNRIVPFPLTQLQARYVVSAYPQSCRTCLAAAYTAITPCTCTSPRERSATMVCRGTVRAPGTFWPWTRRLGRLHHGRRGRSGICSGAAVAPPTQQRSCVGTTFKLLAHTASARQGLAPRASRVLIVVG